MKKILFVSLLFISLYSTAQNNYLGIRGAADFSSVIIQDNQLLDNPEPTLLITGGFTYEYVIKKHFTLGLDLQYSQHGFKQKLLLTNDMGVTIGEEAMITQYNYLGLTLQTGVIIGKKVQWLIKLGATPAYVMRASSEIPAFSHNEDITGNVQRFDLSAQFETGIGFKLGERWKMNICSGYRRSFTTITSDNYWPDSKMYNTALTSSIGISYALSERKIH